MASFPVSTSRPVKRPEFTRRPVPRVRGCERRVAVLALAGDDAPDGKAELLRELEVALVVAGTAMMAPVPYSIST
jgi:hypothetical protein